MLYYNMYIRHIHINMLYYNMNFTTTNIDYRINFILANTNACIKNNREI